MRNVSPKAVSPHVTLIGGFNMLVRPIHNQLMKVGNNIKESDKGSTDRYA